jgi:hypothetical protein
MIRADREMNVSLGAETLGSPDSQRFDFAFIVFEVFVVLLLALCQNPLVGALALTLVLVVPWIAISRIRLFYFLIVYASLLPTQSDLLRYPYLKVSLSPALLISLLVALLILGGFNLLWNADHRPAGKRLDRFFGFFLAWIIFSAIWGLLNADTPKFIPKELIFTMLYAVYFVFIDIFPTNQTIFRFWRFFGFLAVAISIGYVALAISESGVAGALIKRVATQHPHVSLFSIPIFLSGIMFSSGRRGKVWAMIGLFVIFLMVFLSQQRALWLGIVASLLSVYAFYFLKEEITVPKTFKLAGMIAGLLLVLAVVGLLIDKIFMKSSMLTFFVRINTLMDLSSDVSWRIRMAEIHRALEQWRGNVFLGTGLGSTINPVTIQHWSVDLVDNSFVVILWKMGLVGLTAYLLILLESFRLGLEVFRKSDSAEVKGLVAAILSGWIGLLLVAITNSCLVLYRYNLIWASSLATIRLLHSREIRDE